MNKVPACPQCSSPIPGAHYDEACIIPQLAEGGQPAASVDVEAKARELFTEQADRFAAPWDRQWEPTREYWRKQAREALIDAAGGQKGKQHEPHDDCPQSRAWDQPTPQPDGGDEVAGYLYPDDVRNLQEAARNGRKLRTDVWSVPTGQAGAPLYTRPSATMPEQIVVRSGNWAFLADKTNIRPLNSMPVYQTKDGITSSAKLAQTLAEPIRKMNTALTELKADGVCKCCQGTYEECLAALHEVRRAINK